MNLVVIMQSENKPKTTWYELVFETTDLTAKNPALEPYVRVEHYPEWLMNVMAELSRQGLHLSPAKDMNPVTPKKLGLLLGQKCANLYAIGNQVQAAGIDRPEGFKMARSEEHTSELQS